MHNGEIEISQQEIAKHQGNIAKHQKAIGLCLERIEIFEKSLNQSKGPFLLIDNTKSKENSKISVPKEGGTDTMRKNCYRRPDGRWQYSKQQNGYRYYAIANTYRELLEKIPKIKPQKKTEVKRIKSTPKMTVIAYFEYFYDSYIQNKDLTKSTKHEWRAMIENYIKPNFFRQELEKCTTEQIQKFINGIKKETTRGKIFQKVKKVFFKAYVTGRIKQDVTLGLEKPKQKNKLVRSPMTLEEQKAFVAEAKKSKIYAFCMFSLIVGSRREETLKFDLSKDLDETKQTIHIRGTKTDNADREVKVTKAFIEFLKANMKKNTFKMHPTTATKATKDIFNAIGVDKSLHELRHTCSANLYFLGAKDKYRQMQLGHASIVITNDIYTHIKENISKADLRDIYGDLYPEFD